VHRAHGTASSNPTSCELSSSLGVGVKCTGLGQNFETHIRYYIKTMALQLTSIPGM
jgi:hypothetical protein